MGSPDSSRRKAGSPRCIGWRGGATLQSLWRNCARAQSRGDPGAGDGLTGGRAGDDRPRSGAPARRQSLARGIDAGRVVMQPPLGSWSLSWRLLSPLGRPRSRRALGRRSARPAFRSWQWPRIACGLRLASERRSVDVATRGPDASGGWTLASPGARAASGRGFRRAYRAVGVVARAAALRVRSTAMATAIATTAIVTSNA